MHKEPSKFKINYFSADRRQELISKGFVLDQEIKNAEETQTDQHLRDVYEKTKADFLGYSCSTDNCISYKTAIGKKPQHTYYADIGKYVEVATPDGKKFECFEIPAQVKMYKGTKYFYKDFPPSHFWVGCQKLAMDYAEWYGGGLNVYANNAPLKLMVLNKSNLEAIYADAKARGNEDDIEAMELLSMIYGVNTSIENQTAWICKKNPQWCGRIWLYDEHDCDRNDPKPNQYMPVWGSNLIHDYFYKYYNIDGTFLEYFISPFRDICDEEISINTKKCKDIVVMDKTDPNYWENWALSLPPSNEFMLNESYPPNIGFKINNWYRAGMPTMSTAALEPNKVRILTYNVRYLTSANLLRTEVEILDQLIDLIRLSNANIIFIQEFPSPKLAELRKLSHYQLIHTQNGGQELSLVGLVNLKKNKFTKFEILKDRRRTPRNSILLNFVHHGIPLKIIGTHLEIGGRYMKNTRFVSYPDFYKVYKKNTDTRIEQLKILTNRQPDILIGDMNFNPDDAEMKYIDGLKLKHFDTPITSIHNKKVDFAFFNSSTVDGQEHVLDYFESDHKPVLFDFIAQKKVISGGVPSYSMMNKEGVPSYQFDTNVLPHTMPNATIIIAILSTIVVVLLVILLYLMGGNHSTFTCSGSGSGSVTHNCLITS